jgi:hypothetical protein
VITWLGIDPDDLKTAFSKSRKPPENFGGLSVIDNQNGYLVA